ncbi:MAG: CHAT domain-containing protein, partial [Limnothrix sp.]
DQQDQQFLIEKYSVGLMPSFDLTDTRYQSLRNSSVLAMGSSAFATQNDLPSVPLELDRIRGQVGSGEIFLNENFTVANLLAARQQNPHNIVHLATHGEFLPGTLDNSYIQFWDERIALNDLTRLKLDDPVVNLLVLSACRTALGNRDAELGFAGLAIASGAKSVLGSLWYVSDAGTLGLMTEFYRALNTTTIKAEALRQAQLAMLRGEVTFKKGTVAYSPARGEVEPLPHIPPEVPIVAGQDFSHPYYWSAFNLIGNPW